MTLQSLGGPRPAQGDGTVVAKEVTFTGLHGFLIGVCGFDALAAALHYALS